MHSVTHRRPGKASFPGSPSISQPRRRLPLRTGAEETLQETTSHSLHPEWGGDEWPFIIPGPCSHPFGREGAELRGPQRTATTSSHLPSAPITFPLSLRPFLSISLAHPPLCRPHPWACLCSDPPSPAESCSWLRKAERLLTSAPKVRPWRWPGVGGGGAGVGYKLGGWEEAERHFNNVLKDFKG